MARKTAIDYGKEYAGLIEKTEALEARIKARAEALCKANPKAPIGMGAVGREFEKFGKLTTLRYIAIIMNIEKHLADQHPHQQQSLFN